MMLAALYNKNADNSESVELVVKNLMTTGLIDEAVHKNSYKAAEILCKFGRNIDAYHILMLKEQKYDSSVVKNLALKIANSLISEKKIFYTDLNCYLHLDILMK